MKWYSIAFLIFSCSVARAQNINSNLCGGAVSTRGHLQVLISTAETDELLTYSKGLKSGKYAFSQYLTGQTAASQLGFRKRFGSLYGELVDTSKGLMARNGKVHITEITAAVDALLNEEQFIDRLVARQDWLPVVAYLRSLQNSECAFPSTIRDTPSANGVLIQLNQAYPDLGRTSSAEFERVYDKTVLYARDRIQQYGSVSIWQILAEWRRATLSFAANRAN
jgi:hypothetical protein